VFSLKIHDLDIRGTAVLFETRYLAEVRP